MRSWILWFWSIFKKKKQESSCRQMRDYFSDWNGLTLYPRTYKPYIRTFFICHFTEYGVRVIVVNAYHEKVALTKAIKGTGIKRSDIEIIEPIDVSFQGKVYDKVII